MAREVFEGGLRHPNPETEPCGMSSSCKPRNRPDHSRRHTRKCFFCLLRAHLCRSGNFRGETLELESTRFFVPIEANNTTPIAEHSIGQRPRQLEKGRQQLCEPIQQLFLSGLVRHFTNLLEYVISPN